VSGDLKEHALVKGFKDKGRATNAIAAVSIDLDWASFKT
jgi:hypothetical protein